PRAPPPRPRPGSPPRPSSAPRPRSTRAAAPVSAAPRSAPPQACLPTPRPPPERRAAAARELRAGPLRSSDQAARRGLDEVDEHADLGTLGGHRQQLRQRLCELELRAVENAVRLADVLDLLVGEAAAPQTLGVHAVRYCRVARDHDVRRHVAADDRAAAEEGMGADPGELVHRREPAEDRPVADLDMPGA